MREGGRRVGDGEIGGRGREGDCYQGSGVRGRVGESETLEAMEDEGSLCLEKGDV